MSNNSIKRYQKIIDGQLRWVEIVGECFICKKEIEHVVNDPASGYGTIDNEMICYRCCADVDKEVMRNEKKITLYITDEGDSCYVSNWPGTLKINCVSVSRSVNNWGAKRTDVWFHFENHMWYGVHYGSSHQLINCRQLKGA